MRLGSSVRRHLAHHRAHHVGGADRDDHPARPAPPPRDRVVARRRGCELDLRQVARVAVLAVERSRPRRARTTREPSPLPCGPAGSASAVPQLPAPITATRGSLITAPPSTRGARASEPVLLPLQDPAHVARGARRSPLPRPPRRAPERPAGAALNGSAASSASAATIEASDTIRDTPSITSQTASAASTAARRERQEHTGRRRHSLAAPEAHVDREDVPDDGCRAERERPLPMPPPVHERREERRWEGIPSGCRTPSPGAAILAPSTRKVLVAPRLPLPCSPQVDPP